MIKISIIIPPIPRKAELPLIFLLFFLPAYLNQSALPYGIFDYPLYQGQIILQSLLLFFLIRYLTERNPPSALHEYDSAFAPALLPLQSLICFGGLASIYAVYNFVLIPLLPAGGFAGPETEPILITRPVMLPLALVCCLTAAGMEEFFFRGYAYLRLRESGLNSLPALLTISTLFAAGHLYEGVPAALFAWGTGLFLGFLVTKNYTLYSLTLSHGFFNFSMILISYLRQRSSS